MFCLKVWVTVCLNYNHAVRSDLWLCYAFIIQRKTENEEEKQRGIVSTDLLGARGFKHLGPVSSIEEFSSELFGKVRICKVWPVVVLHKLSDGRS